MKGWPSPLKLNGFDIREDSDFLYIYRNNKLAGTFNRCTTRDEIQRFCREVSA